jgi:hypothetical protein
MLGISTGMHHISETKHPDSKRHPIYRRDTQRVYGDFVRDVVNVVRIDIAGVQGVPRQKLAPQTVHSVAK